MGAPGSCHYNLKAILTDNKDGFTDDEWKMVNHWLSQNRLNDEQF
jgi:hypothetical protein